MNAELVKHTHCTSMFGMLQNISTKQNIRNSTQTLDFILK